MNTIIEAQIALLQTEDQVKKYLAGPFNIARTNKTGVREYTQYNPKITSGLASESSAQASSKYVRTLKAGDEAWQSIYRDNLDSKPDRLRFAMLKVDSNKEIELRTTRLVHIYDEEKSYEKGDLLTIKFADNIPVLAANTDYLAGQIIKIQNLAAVAEERDIIDYFVVRENFTSGADVPISDLPADKDASNEWFGVFDGRYGYTRGKWTYFNGDFYNITTDGVQYTANPDNPPYVSADLINSSRKEASLVGKLEHIEKVTLFKLREAIKATKNGSTYVDQGPFSSKGKSYIRYTVEPEGSVKPINGHSDFQAWTYQYMNVDSVALLTDPNIYEIEVLNTSSEDVQVEFLAYKF